MYEEVRRLLERRVVCQIVDVVATIEKDALFPVDERGLGAVEINIRESTHYLDLTGSH